jgi:hypothetical protein
MAMHVMLITYCIQKLTLKKRILIKIQPRNYSQIVFVHFKSNNDVAHTISGTLL